MSDELQVRMIEHIPALRAFARSLVRNREGADDLVQSTLERAIRKIHLYEPTGSFEGWLNQIARNVFLDTVRRQRTERATSEDLPSGELSRKESQIDQLLVKQLRVAMERLPVDQKQILLMIGIEGMRYEEAAKELGVPLGTVRSRLFRARANLQQLVRAEDGPVRTPVPHLSPSDAVHT